MTSAEFRRIAEGGPLTYPVCAEIWASKWYGAQRTLPSGIASWQHWKRFQRYRKLANNTYLHEVQTGYAVCLHQTDILTFRPDGTVVLDSGGHLTRVTRERINRYMGEEVIHGSCRISRGRFKAPIEGDWCLWADPDRPFEDGMVIQRTEHVPDWAPDWSNWRPEDVNYLCYLGVVADQLEEKGGLENFRVAGHLREMAAQAVVG